VDWFRSAGGRLFGAELGDVGKVSWPAPPPVADEGPEQPFTALTLPR
jgi:hypothetical protein